MYHVLVHRLSSHFVHPPLDDFRFAILDFVQWRLVLRRHSEMLVINGWSAVLRASALQTQLAETRSTVAVADRVCGVVCCAKRCLSRFFKSQKRQTIKRKSKEWMPTSGLTITSPEALSSAVSLFGPKRQRAPTARTELHGTPKLQAVVFFHDHNSHFATQTE